MNRIVIVALLAAGCEKDLLADMDAGVDSPVDSAAALHCPAAADPGKPGTYKLFLNFDGVTLSKCNVDDSRTNCSTVVPAETVFPSFFATRPERDSWIDSIIFNVSERLAPFSIDIVTTRPASGDYYMQVFGGTAADTGVNPNFFNLQPVPCSAANRNMVGVIFDHGLMFTQQDYATAVLNQLGYNVGLSTTTMSPTYDCLCTNCAFQDRNTCTFGTDEPVAAVRCAGAGDRQDEQAVLAQTLGCR